MAVIELPSIRTVITGVGVTQFDSSTSFSLTEKLEAAIYIKSTDNKITIDYSFVDNVKSLIFNSSGTYTVEITTTSTDVVPVVTVMQFQVSGMFRLDLTQAQRALISAIKISTASTTNILVDVRAYGVSI